MTYRTKVQLLHEHVQRKLLCLGMSCATSYSTPYKVYMGNSPKWCVHALKLFSIVITEV